MVTLLGMTNCQLCQTFDAESSYQAGEGIREKQSSLNPRKHIFTRDGEFAEAEPWVGSGLILIGRSYFGLPPTRDFGELSRVAQAEDTPSNVSKCFLSLKSNSVLELCPR